MQEFIDEKARTELRKILAGLASPVKLLFFTQANPSPA
jgi:hypothetical protein